MGPKWVKIGRFRGPKSWIWGDESMTNMTFGGPDPQIDGFGPLLGSKSGGPRLTGMPKSLCTAVQPVRWDPRRGQNPSQNMTQNGSFWRSRDPISGSRPPDSRCRIPDLGVRTPKLTVLDHFWGPNPVGPSWLGHRNPFVRSSDPPDGPFGGVKTPPK